MRLFERTRRGGLSASLYPKIRVLPVQAPKALVDLYARTVADALGVEPRIEPQPMQPGDVLRTFADVSKARRLLDYRPTTPVEEGIPRFVEWLRSHSPQR
jgi:nucleoside-diphosphate-sugar epimerase